MKSDNVNLWSDTSVPQSKPQEADLWGDTSTSLKPKDADLWGDFSAPVVLSNVSNNTSVSAKLSTDDSWSKIQPHVVPSIGILRHSRV